MSYPGHYSYYLKYVEENTSNNSEIDFVNINVYTKGQLVSNSIPWQYTLAEMKKIRYDGPTDGQGKSSTAPIFQIRALIKT